MPYKPDSWDLTERQHDEMQTEMQVEADNVNKIYMSYNTVVVAFKGTVRDAYEKGFKHGVASERKRERSG